MSTKLFVGGLSWGTTEDQIRQLFEPYGNLDEVKLITDRETGNSRGFGFVTFSEKEPAQRAIAELNGKELDGRTIRVDEARESSPNRGGGGGFKPRRNRW